MHFTDVVESRIEKTRKVLIKKEEEYARSDDRYHNFKVAGRVLDCSPERALLGMLIKHFVSVVDIIDSLDNYDKPLVLHVVDEKIGDSINYLILLEGMLRNRMELDEQCKD